MNWYHLKLCLLVLILFTSYFVNSKEDDKNNLHYGEEELIPPEQIIHTEDAVTSDKMESVKLTDKHARKKFLPNLSSKGLGYNFGFPFGQGTVTNPLVGQPLDAQESSASNNVVLVLDNDKNKLAELVKPGEESFRRLTRNPDVFDEIVGQFNQFGDNVAQQIMQQVAQTAPEMSKTFGQALNEALAQTTLLAQTPPGNLNLTQLAQNLGQPNLDFSQLGQYFMLGATHQSTENTHKANAAAETAANKFEAKSASAAKADTHSDHESEPRVGQRNPFEGLIGQPLLPPFNFGLPPFGAFSPLKLFNPLLPLPSDVSEVHVRPDNYSPYKLTPKEVDRQTMADMNLKAVLRDALVKKTIPILWFHLPSDYNVQKSSQDLEMETKLKMFENQVVEELKQLQELSKLANELKRAQLQSGLRPTTSLTTNLNLSEIPVYDITLGDIEKTLNDEHVIMLMNTIVQNQNRDYHRHHQASTKYLTDLTGTPIKRQVNPEDALKALEKDDMLKMMTYAYRMALMNGHEMPWLKNEQLFSPNTNDPRLTTMPNQEIMNNMEIKAEKQWCKDKQQQMAIDAEKRMGGNQQNNFMRQWADPNMPNQMQFMMGNTQHTAEKQWWQDKQQQMAIEAERRRGATQQNNFMRQWADPNMPNQKQFMMGNTQNLAEKQWWQDKRQQMAMEAERQRGAIQQNSFMRQIVDTDMTTEMQPIMGTTEMTTEKQWLDSNGEQMAVEADMQTKIEDDHKLDDNQQKMLMRQWAGNNMPIHKQPMMGNTQNMAERLWLEEKKRQMSMEAERQRAAIQRNTFMRQFPDPHISTQMQSMTGKTEMTTEKQWLQANGGHIAVAADMQTKGKDEHKLDDTQKKILMRQWANPNLHIQKQSMMMGNTKNIADMTMQRKNSDENRRANSYQNIFTRQWFNPIQGQMQQMKHQFPHKVSQQHPMQREMMDPNMQHLPEQKMENMQQEIMPNINMPPQMIQPVMPQPNQNQWVESHMQQTQSIQGQWTDSNMPQAPSNPKTIEQAKELELQAKENIKATVESVTGQKTAESDIQTEHKEINSTTLAETIPQTAENEDKARFKGLKDLFDDLNIFDNGKNKNKQVKPIIYNYYYNTGYSRYPPMYGSTGGYQTPSPPSPPHYGSYPPVYGSSGGYQTPSPPTPPPYYSHYPPMYGSSGGYQTPTPPSPPPYYGPPTGGYGKPTPTPAPPSYHYPVYPKYKSTADLYGGGGYGSNAYGSYNGYRAAVGDEEIAIMLKQHNLLPKMMVPNNDDPLFSIDTTVKELDVDNANTTKILSKRLAKNGNKFKNSPTAYLLVVRSNNKSNNKKSRSKRSTTEYATLEPIDENSLNILRKMYKNSLKEITLNTNETPEEALMRYNAESIREALEKANQQPMEVAADAENQEIVNTGNQIEQHQKQLHNQHMPMAYVLNDNDQFVPVQSPISESHTTANTPLHLQHFYDQQPGFVYVTSHQESLNNKYAVKYKNPFVFESNPQVLLQNPYESLHNSMDTVPYVYDYKVPNERYIMASPNTLNSIPKTTTPILYQKSFMQPQLNYDPALAIGFRNLYSHTDDDEEISNTNSPPLLTNAISKHQVLDTPQPKSLQKKLRNRFKMVGTQEIISFENILSVIKESLTQCCNECKNKIFKSLDETFKHKQGYDDNAVQLEKPHILTYRKPSNENDVEYKQWQTEMSEKGYNKNYLTKQHQKEYFKDNKLNLHITTEDSYGHKNEEVFSKNNQSYKRETSEFDLEKKAKITAPLKIINRIEKLTANGNQNKEKKEIEYKEIQLENKDYGKEFINEFEEEEIKTKPLTDGITQTQEKLLTTEKPTQSLKNNIKTMNTAETTTHSAYAMRGQFRSPKLRAMPFAVANAKHFDTYKNINKIGKVNAIAKAAGKNNNNRIEKNDKLEEILDLLHDISKHAKESSKEIDIIAHDLQATDTNTTPSSSSSATEGINTSHASGKVTHKKSRVPLRVKETSKISAE